MTDLLDRLKSAVSDRYSIERELGRGGMATVYLAHDSKLNREVALKVLSPELAASIGSDRFLREIEISARLTHPNILGLYDCGEADGLLYYTMPFVEGESLRDRMKREQRLPLGDTLRISKEVADMKHVSYALMSLDSVPYSLARSVIGAAVDTAHRVPLETSDQGGP